MDERFNKYCGFIDYRYYKDDKYPNGILILMGSYVYKPFRNKGCYKQMVIELFNNFDKGVKVHVAIQNKHLLNFFKRLDFKETDFIEYWGKPSNTINLKGIINFK